MARKARSQPVELALVGEVEDWEKDVLDRLLEAPPGGQCVFYIDSSGGSVYGALAVVALLRHRPLQARAVVLGECSSATLLVFAACPQRLVTRYSAFLFHRMHWESEKRVTASEARSWAHHFEHLEKELDELLVRLLGKAADQVLAWTREDRYVMGDEIVAAGLADLLEIT
jgi:ATP-dependent protease ClpP protease subunit